MQDKQLFDPEKLTMIEFKMIKGQVDTPEEFDIHKIDGYQLENSLQLSFNLIKKLAKVVYSINLKSDSKGENEEEAKGSFDLMFVYKVLNIDELVLQNEDKSLDVNPLLATALTSVSYSTARGILLTRMQGTSLQNFILPVIKPNELIRK